MATASTTYEDPYLLARKFASLDHLSAGRSGWNVVTSTDNATARNFGRDKQLTAVDRYERAEEFVDTVKELWDSWEDGARIENKETGQYYDLSKVHELNHKGSFYSVKGPLNMTRTPQGRPVIVQAGSSQSGQALAGRGHRMEVINDSYQDFGAGQFIWRLPGADGAPGLPAVDGYVAASDPRRDGQAVGF